MLCIWDAGIQNELFYLIYKLNKEAKIIVFTPYDPTEEFYVMDLVKQGTCNGPILCSLSTGEYCKTKQTPNSGVFIGTVRISSLAFVDDLTDPNSKRSDILNAHEFVKHFEKAERLDFSVSKCKTLCVNPKEKSEQLEINDVPLEQVEYFKYLGDHIYTKGNNDDLIENPIIVSRQKLVSIQAMCKEIALGNYKIQILLQLYESILLSSLLFNCQSWTSIRNSVDTPQIESVQLKYLKQTMHVHAPYSIPNAVCF